MQQQEIYLHVQQLLPNIGEGSWCLQFLRKLTAISLLKQSLMLSYFTVHIAALNFSFCKCVIESDYKVCIDAFKVGGNSIPWRLLDFVDLVKNVISVYDHVFFNWVHREANQVAHVLINWSLNQSWFGSSDLGFGLPGFVNVILVEASQAIVSRFLQFLEQKYYENNFRNKFYNIGCHALNLIPGFVTMTGMLISSLNLVLTRTNLTFTKASLFLSFFFSTF